MNDCYHVVLVMWEILKINYLPTFERMDYDEDVKVKSHVAVKVKTVNITTNLNLILKTDRIE